MGEKEDKVRRWWQGFEDFAKKMLKFKKNFMLLIPKEDEPLPCWTFHFPWRDMPCLKLDRTRKILRRRKERNGVCVRKEIDLPQVRQPKRARASDSLAHTNPSCLSLNPLGVARFPKGNFFFFLVDGIDGGREDDDSHSRRRNWLLGATNHHHHSDYFQEIPFLLEIPGEQNSVRP